MTKTIEDFILSKNKIVAISNAKASKEIEDFTKNYDCIIRFNKGANRISLSEKLKGDFNNRIDLAVLSGWSYAFKKGLFGPLEGFENTRVFFARPKCEHNIQHYFRRICVQEQYGNFLSSFSDIIDYMPLNICYDFKKRFHYDHPTTGLLILYYISEHLNKHIDCINMYEVDNAMPNAFTRITWTTKHASKEENPHKLELESQILNEFNISKISI